MEKKPVKFVPSGGTSENAIASLLKKLAFAVFILGFIGGIVIGKTVVPPADLYRFEADKFHFEYAVVAWFSAFFLGALLLGVSCLLYTSEYLCRVGLDAALHSVLRQMTLDELGQALLQSDPPQAPDAAPPDADAPEKTPVSYTHLCLP